VRALHATGGGRGRTRPSGRETKTQHDAKFLRTPQQERGSEAVICDVADEDFTSCRGRAPYSATLELVGGRYDRSRDHGFSDVSGLGLAVVLPARSASVPRKRRAVPTGPERGREGDASALPFRKPVPDGPLDPAWLTPSRCLKGSGAPRRGYCRRGSWRRCGWRSWPTSMEKAVRAASPSPPAPPRSQRSGCWVIDLSSAAHMSDGSAVTATRETANGKPQAQNEKADGAPWRASPRGLRLAFTPSPCAPPSVADAATSRHAFPPRSRPRRGKITATPKHAA